MKIARLQKPPNSWYKLALSLKAKKHRKIQKLSLAEGDKLITEAWKAGIPLHSAAFTAESAREHYEILKALQAKGIEVFSLSPGEMERISALKSPPGSLLIYRTDFEVPARESRIILGLNRVSDPGNLGSIIRTADWFGVSRVILSRQSAELHHPLTVRGSMGAVFRIPVSEEAELAEEAYRLKREGCKIAIAATRGGVRPGKLEGKIALFFSDEQGNLPEEIVRNAEVIFTIPRLGGGESLNLGVACGVILNEITKSRIEKRSKNDKKSHFKKL